MSDESQRQVTRKDDTSELILSSTRSSLVARGRLDAALLAVPCNKCGERKELVFAGCVCANCSDALDREWATSTATDWFITRPFREDSVGYRVADYVLLNTSYARMKMNSWASNAPLSGVCGFFRIRQATPEEIAYLKSLSGIWSLASGARAVRRATPEEVVTKNQSDLEWEIATETDQIIHETCKGFGIQMNEHNAPIGEPQRVELAAEEIAERLRKLGWFEELAKMKRDDSDALHAMDGAQLLEMALRR